MLFFKLNLRSIRALLPSLLLGFAAPMPAPAQSAPPTYKVAFIGLRHHVTWIHLGHLLKGQAGPVKLVAIAENVPELVAEAKSRGATDVPYYDDYNKMLDEVKPDFVWGYVENNRRLEVAQACAPRKIHVMFQKPLAATYEQAVAIRDLARKHGIQVLVNYDMAFYATMHAAKARADAGEIGKVWRMHGIVGHGGPNIRGKFHELFFQAWVFDPAQSGGGALIDFGSYDAAWAVWFKGLPESVYATSRQLRPEKYPKVDDAATLVLNYKDGVGIFEASWSFPRGIQDLELFGPAGSLRASQDIEVVLRKGREPATKLEVPPLPPEMAGPMQHMSHCLTNKQTVGGMAALDLNVGVMEILEAAKRSIETGRAVTLPLK